MNDIEYKVAFDNAVKRDSKIDAIKAYRLWKNVGFKEATTFIQDNWEKLRRAHY